MAPILLFLASMLRFPFHRTVVVLLVWASAASAFAESRWHPWQRGGRVQDISRSKDGKRVRKRIRARGVFDRYTFTAAAKERYVEALVAGHNFLAERGAAVPEAVRETSDEYSMEWIEGEPTSKLALAKLAKDAPLRVRLNREVQLGHRLLRDAKLDDLLGIDPIPSNFLVKDGLLLPRGWIDPFTLVVKQSDLVDPNSF